MKKCYVFFLMLIIFSCRITIDQGEYRPQMDIVETKNFSMGITDVHCTDTTKNTFRRLVTIARDRKDTLVLETDVNLCRIYQDSLQKSHSIRSLIDLRLKNDSLAYNAHVYLMRNEKGEKIREVTMWHYMKMCREDCSMKTYRKTMEYKIRTSNYKIVSSSLPKDSIGSIYLVHEMYSN